MPKSVHGFTLVELLVVITIIAVLSVIGMTAYGVVQKNARDTKRKLDIDAIANALEVNKTGASYQVISGGWFSSGSIPIDPKASTIADRPSGCGNGTDTDYIGRCWYCIRVNNTQTYCQAGDHRIDDPGNEWGIDAHNHSASWTICANLETGSPKYYCRGSRL